MVESQTQKSQISFSFDLFVSSWKTASFEPRPEFSGFASKARPGLLSW